MDIKNFLGNLSGGSDKIKIAIFGLFVLMVAVFFAFSGMLEQNYVAGANICNRETQGQTSCGPNGENESAVRSSAWASTYECIYSGEFFWVRKKSCANEEKCCVIGGNATCVDANYNCGGASSSSSALAQQNQDLSLTSAQNVADGGACPCGLAHAVICSASAPSVNGGYCKNGNCVDGKCKLLECAISDSDGKIIARIGEGVKTCTKPSVLSGDGVYVCGEDSQEPQKLYSSDGSLSSEKEPFSGTIVYNLIPDEAEGTCYSGCSNGKCNDEAKCKGGAGDMVAAFSSYKNGVASCKNTCIYDEEDKYKACGDCYKTVKEDAKTKLKQIIGAGDGEKAFNIFEELAYPKGWPVKGAYIISPKSSLSLGSQSPSFDADDILCAKTDTGSGGMTMNTACGKISVTEIQKNKICVGKDGEKFSSFLRGKSFDCVKVESGAMNGCGVAGWILGKTVEKCNPGETNAFTSSDYFSKSGGKNANGMPVMGWGKGADQYGCEYVAYSQFAKVSSTDKNKNLYTYVQIPTGDCHKSAASITTASGDFSCADEFLESGETTTESEAKVESYVITESGGTLAHRVKVSSGYGYNDPSCAVKECTLAKSNASPQTNDKLKCTLNRRVESGQNYFVCEKDIKEIVGNLAGVSAQVFCTVECGEETKSATATINSAMAAKGVYNCTDLKGKEVAIGKSICGTSDSSKNKMYKCEGAEKEKSNADSNWEIKDCAQENKVCREDQPGEARCADEDEEEPEKTGKCDFKINALKNACSTSNSKCRSGVYVPFTITETSGNCDDLSCTVTNDFDNTAVDATKASAGWWACSYPQSKSSGGDSEGTKGSDPSNLKFTIDCDGKKATMTCPFPTADSNKFCEEEEEAQEEEKAEEGEKCKKDEDCGEGLVCLDGECVTEEDAEEKEEQEKQDKTAPKVTISSPSGTINTKTAELSVSTDIEAECKYMLSRDGSFNDFSGGMFMSGGGGKSHTATLSNLTGVTAADCKYNHTVKVMCKNSKASQDAKSAVGSAQNNFSVDLSQDSANAPAVSSAPMEAKYTVANPVLKVTTDRPADCEYKKDGDFTFGGGTKFDTTGNYTHNTQLNGLGAGDHTYYVVCKDKETCAVSKPGLPVKFAVDLSQDPANAPNIANTTPETQTIANPALSVTTDRPATCQYKKDTSFTYDDGSGTQFANDGEYAHSVSLADLPDGKHTFYVACKDKATGAKKTLETAIATTLNRGGAAGAPVISNTTPASQSTSNPTLSVLTDRAAVCQYNKDADFAYGAGTQFTIDGGTGHSAVLSNIADGTHTYYVVCADSATQASNSPGAQIMFSVSTAAEVCADISSNDKQSDIDRDYGDDADYDSAYIWRSSPAGVLEMFEKVDWYAGYQFTPEKNGSIAELCGYFDSGSRNRVSLYDGAYKEIAGVEIDGQGGWSCASISPAAVKADRRYYVIARVQDDAIYFAYDSGMLPRDTEGAVVDSGVRQLASAGDFGESLKKYDYMVFGLVDAKIRFVDENSQGPEISTPLPSGNREESDLILSVQTDEDATCKFDRQDAKYGEMKYSFGATGQKLHQQKVCDLSEGEFTWYVRCKGQSGTNDGSSAIRFKVDD